MFSAATLIFYTEHEAIKTANVVPTVISLLYIIFKKGGGQHLNKSNDVKKNTIQGTLYLLCITDEYIKNLGTI